MNQFSVNYHDGLDESKAIVVDTEVFTDMWSIRIGDISIFMNPPRARKLMEAIEKALAAIQPAPEVAAFTSAITLNEDAPEGYTVEDAIAEQDRDQYLAAKRSGEDV